MQTIAEWTRATYKPDRFRNEAGFNHDREQRKIAMQEEEFREYGYVTISRHDSITGDVEFFGAAPWRTA
jgi:hypothetical protein